MRLRMLWVPEIRPWDVDQGFRDAILHDQALLMGLLVGVGAKYSVVGADQVERGPMLKA